MYTHTEPPLFRFTQDLFTACERNGVVMVNIELVSGTLGRPINISVDVDGVFNSILTFPRGSVPNTQRNFSINSISTNQIHVAMATATPVGVFQSDRTTIAHFTNASEQLNACIMYQCIECMYLLSVLLPPLIQVNLSSTALHLYEAPLITMDL